MEELDWSQRDLAKAVGCSQPAIAWVFRPTSKQSALVPKIHKALGLTRPTPPATGAVDPLRAELDEMLESASDDVLRHIVATVKLITGTKKAE
jgi:predicted transcriptional regulator